MAPILIDTRSLLKFGFISLFVTVTVFCGGFLFGYERAVTIQRAGSDIRPLSLPARVVTDDAIEQRTPAVVSAGIDIDVDYPEIDVDVPGKEVAATVEDKVSNLTDELKSDFSNADIPGLPVTSKSDTTLIESDVKQNSNKKSKNIVVASNNTKTASKTSVNKMSDTNKTVLSALSADTLSGVNYSIQVGMYGRLVNAENMMKMLQAKELDAYVSNFVNKKDETRYNVRVGYFVDKKSAITALKDYKNSEKGDGYLVKFNAENIVDLADAGIVKSPAVIKEAATIPESIAQEVIFDKVSQADFTNTSEAKKSIKINSL